MRKVHVDLPGGGYEILIGAALADDLEAAVSGAGVEGRWLVVSDANVTRLHAGAIGHCLKAAKADGPAHIVPGGDGAKTVVELERLWDRLAADGVDRSGGILAVGGGVVSDLAGFAAATWMRGIRWAVLPTTLEACIDAGVGGKTGINRPGAKNLVGVFHQPAFVLIDPAFLETVEDRDWRAGLAESVKHGLIRDAEFFAFHERNLEPILTRQPDVVEELIANNCRIKAEVVRADEREERGVRESLNFGHTIGHAIEQALDYELRHGECVALGMIAAAHIARARGLISAEDESRIGKLIKRIGLPTRLPRPIAAERLIDLARADKKTRAGQRRFVLLNPLGHCQVVEGVRDEEIQTALAMVE